MTAWHLRAIRLPDGVTAEDSWLSPDGWQDMAVRDAQELPGRFALAGLVDAHSHVSFAEGGDDPLPLDITGAEANLDRYARDGVAVVRDAGGMPSVVLALRHVSGRPRVVPAGRHMAPSGMYFAAVHDPVEAEDVVEVALREVAAGATWVKVVADFPPASALAFSANAPAEQTYSLDVMRELITAAHQAGARVAAHVTTTLVRDLVQLGVDSVEHGPMLDRETIAVMAQRGTAWTPTLCAVLSVPHDATKERRRRVDERRARLRDLLPIAVRLGVPVLTGSDVVGSIPREIALLVDCGLDPADALRAATSTAMTFLGAEARAAPAAVVTFSEDPRDDPAALTRPAAVVIGGVRVR